MAANVDSNGLVRGRRLLRIAAAIVGVHVLLGYAVFVWPNSFAGYNFLETAPIVAAWLPGSLWLRIFGSSPGLTASLVVATIVSALALSAVFGMFRLKFVRIAWWVILCLEVSCLLSLIGLGLYYRNPGQESSERMVGLGLITLFGGIPAIAPAIACLLLLWKPSRAAANILK